MAVAVFAAAMAFAAPACARSLTGKLGDRPDSVTGRSRFPSVANSTDARVTVTLASGENAVQLAGYAPRRPAVRPMHGSVESMQYHAATHLFRMTIQPAAAAGARTAELVIR